MKHLTLGRFGKETKREEQTLPTMKVEEEDGRKEAELVRLSQGGDREAFNLLVARYERQVYNLALRMLADSEAAADATQDCFISAFAGIRGFHGGNLRAWLLRIATNACYDQLRSLKRRPIASLDDLLLDPEHPTDFEDPAESPEDYTLRQELGRTIQAGLLTLPAEQRAVLILSDVQGFSYEEIAEITKSSLGTVKSRLSRSRKHLRDYLLGRRELLPKKYRL